jgi:acetylornithine deacetylase/succinyl-diaminopimelate desuccinylase-like protein
LQIRTIFRSYLRRGLLRRHGRGHEGEARGQRYVLVTEPARHGGKIVTERKGIGVFVIRTRGRPAHAGGDPDKGRNAIVPWRRSCLRSTR